jgi:hypothetical protein
MHASGEDEGYPRGRRSRTHLRPARTSGTTVTLTGHVRTWAEHDAVIAAAWMASGVMDVADQLYIAA